MARRRDHFRCPAIGQSVGRAHPIEACTFSSGRVVYNRLWSARRPTALVPMVRIRPVLAADEELRQLAPDVPGQAAGSDSSEAWEDRKRSPHTARRTDAPASSLASATRPTRPPPRGARNPLREDSHGLWRRRHRQSQPDKSPNGAPTANQRLTNG